MARLPSGRFDLMVQVGYPPPLGGEAKKRGVQEKAIAGTIDFLRANIASAKQRTTPITGLDLNSGLGLKGSADPLGSPLVGAHHLGQQGLAGHAMERLLRDMAMVSISTMHEGAGPTFFPAAGEPRLLDHWIGPQGIRHIVRRC